MLGEHVLHTYIYYKYRRTAKKESEILHNLLLLRFHSMIAHIRFDLWLGFFFRSFFSFSLCVCVCVDSNETFFYMSCFFFFRKVESFFRVFIIMIISLLSENVNVFLQLSRCT